MKMSAKKTLLVTEKEQIDKVTGEIISENYEVTTSSFTPEPNYVKLYLEDIGRLNDLSNSANNILLEFIRSMSYGNVIPVFMPIKKMIAKKLDISVHSVDKAVKEFSKKGLFIRVERGMYMADPKLFGKGRWSDIKKLRLVIEYDEKGGKKLKSNISEKLQLKLGI